MARKKEPVNLDGCFVWLLMIAIVGGTLLVALDNQYGWGLF